MYFSQGKGGAPFAQPSTQEIVRPTGWMNGVIVDSTIERRRKTITGASGGGIGSSKVVTHTYSRYLYLVGEFPPITHGWHEVRDMPRLALTVTPIRAQGKMQEVAGQLSVDNVLVPYFENRPNDSAIFVEDLGEPEWAVTFRLELNAQEGPTEFTVWVFGFANIGRPDVWERVSTSVTVRKRNSILRL